MEKSFNYGDERRIHAIISGKSTFKKEFGTASSTEQIVLAFVFGCELLLHESVRSFRDGWRRLDERQRALVLKSVEEVNKKYPADHEF